METLESFLDRLVSLCAGTKGPQRFSPPAPGPARRRPTHLVGEELQNQVTLALDLGGAGSRLQLKPGVVAAHRHLLEREARREATRTPGLGSDGRRALTFRGMLIQPRKSSAFSSEPDDADPLARTDLAICLKYLLVTRERQREASGRRFIFYGRKQRRRSSGRLPAHPAKSADFIELLAGLRH